VAGVDREEQMMSSPLLPGARLGPYEIEALVGEGGMGAVYRARDTRLDRTVAIKVLPPEWAGSPEMQQRFDREAQAIASLNHPNICALHDRGPDYLVMEYLEGETLAERLTRGPLPVSEALNVAIAIADALDRAHGQGVVHRDLKPGNIMLSPAGPKLLDFGLAKYVAPLGAPDGTAASPRPTRSTPVTPLTKAGAIVGTLQYMAPEQLDGLEADRRTDIFALGVVLHEMVTGRRAFEGKSQVLLISAIATADPPPISRIQPATPPALDHVVKVCLAKDPDERWQSARDLLAELRWIAGGGADAGLAGEVGAASRGTSRWTRFALAGAVVLLAATSVPAVGYFRGEPEPDRIELRMSANPLNYSGVPTIQGFFAVSPDGRQIVMRARAEAGSLYSLHVGTLDFLTPRPLSGTDEAVQPFWSPNGREIAFVTAGKLKKIEAAGGPPRPICDAADFKGGTWNADGTIVFGSETGLFRVPAEGGQPVPVTTVGPGEAGHYWPRFLPDGRRFLYLSWSTEASAQALVAGSLDDKTTSRIMPVESNVAYTAPGFLVFRRETSLYAQRFDPVTLKVSGDATRLADAVNRYGATGRAAFDLSPNGVLAFYRDLTDTTSMGMGSLAETREWQLAWVNRTGQEPAIVGKFGVLRGAEVSPDGTRVAVHRHETKGGDVSVIEPNGTETRITFDATQDNSNPVWSPNGQRLVYASLRNGKWGLYQAASDGSGKEELLVESDLPKVPLSWSPDGLRLVYWVRDPKTAGDLWVLPFDGDKKAVAFLATNADERHGQISPDGKWIAYSSTLFGRREVFVQPFPEGGGRWQISPTANAGAGWPRWSRKEKENELVYHSLGVGPNSTSPVPATIFLGPLYSVSWKAAGGSFTHDPPRDVVGTYAVEVPHGGGDYHTFSLTPDGQRFLILQTVLTAAQTADDLGPDPPAGVTILMHWTKGLKR